MSPQGIQMPVEAPVQPVKPPARGTDRSAWADSPPAHHNFRSLPPVRSERERWASRW